MNTRSLSSLTGLAALGLALTACGSSSNETGVPGVPVAQPPGAQPGVPVVQPPGAQPGVPVVQPPGAQPGVPVTQPPAPQPGVPVTQPPAPPGAPEAPVAQPGAPVAPPGPALSAEATPPEFQRLQRRHYLNSVAQLFAPYGVSTEALGHPIDPIKEGFRIGGTLGTTQTETYRTNAEALSRALVAAINDNPALAGCQEMNADCASEFSLKFAETAYRRPLTPDQAQRIETVRAIGEANLVDGIGYVAAFVLQSPSFLFYLDPNDDQGDYTLASQLSYFLWDSPPDAATLELAANRQLSTPAVFEAHVDSMLADERATAVMAEFANQWLGLPDITSLSKDAAVFPEFESAIPMAMLADAQAFVASSLSQQRSLEALFGDEAQLSPELTALLAPYGEVGTTRQGILSQPGILSMLAGPQKRSPIVRGTYVLERLLCVHLETPPGVDLNAAAESIAMNNQNLTLRESIDATTSPADCAGCHNIINPLGYGFDNYNAIGLPIQENLPASLFVPGASEITFNGIEDMQAQLAITETFANCAADHVMAFANTIPHPSPADAAVLKAAFVQSADIKGVFRAVAATLLK